MPSNKNEKTEQLKAEIDKWIQEFSASQKKFERFDVYSGEQLSLGFLAYKDDKGQTTVLISIHGQCKLPRIGIRGYHTNNEIVRKT